MSYWTEIGATEALQMLYPRILGREIDSSGLNNWRHVLVKDGWTMRKVIEEIAKHPEPNQLFDEPYRPRELWGYTIRFMYQQLLDRAPENQQVEIVHSAPLYREGFFKLRQNIIHSQEYTSKWGEEGVPGVGHNQPPGAGGFPPPIPRH